jgi:surfeit locus 1 family protein
LGVTGQRPPFFATLFTLISLVILCTLGTWQLQRLSWKTVLLANIQAEIHKDAAGFIVTPQDIPQSPEDTFFMRGTVQGVFDYKNEIRLGPKAADGFFMNQILTPLIFESGETLLVQRGWAMEKTVDLEAINRQRTGQREWVSGYFRKPQAGYPIHKFIGIENSPAMNRWHYINIAQIAQAKGLNMVLPVVLYAEDASYAPAAWPKIEYQDIRLPNNNHKHYAAFWFTMAGVLLLIFVLRFCVTRRS